MKRTRDATELVMHKRARHIVSNKCVCDMPAEFWTAMLRPHLDDTTRARLRTCCLGLYALDVRAVMQPSVAYWLRHAPHCPVVKTALTVLADACGPDGLWALYPLSIGWLSADCHGKDKMTVRCGMELRQLRVKLRVYPDRIRWTLYTNDDRSDDDDLSYTTGWDIGPETRSGFLRQFLTRVLSEDELLGWIQRLGQLEQG